MNKLLILSKDHLAYREIIYRDGFLDLSIVSTDDTDVARKNARGCNIIFGEPHLISKVINELLKVVWVQSTWAGIEPLLGAGIRRDYVLTNARNVYGQLMAEYVFGYLLFIERRMLQRWQSQKESRWDTSLSSSLKDKTIGLLGVGTIGAQLAKTANHFGMLVYGYTLKSENCPDVDIYFHKENVKEFCKDLNYLICSLPGTPLTKNIIDARFLAELSEKAWLVNIGRGSTIDEPALAETLNMRRLAGAVLDVFQNEPLPIDHPFWKTPNTFITAHTAAKNYPPDIASIFIQNYFLFLEGKELLYQVDFERQY